MENIELGMLGLVVIGIIGLSLLQGVLGQLREANDNKVVELRMKHLSERHTQIRHLFDHKLIAEDDYRRESDQIMAGMKVLRDHLHARRFKIEV